MLKKIKKIKNAGIFHDFTAKIDLQEFNVFNLLYGWNGSGKTTLSRLLTCLETKQACPAFPAAEFEITLDDGSNVKHTTLATFQQKVFVFNQAFVEENIDWRKQGAKSIVVISEDNIDKRKQYFDLKDKQIPVARVNWEAAETIFKASNKEKEDFLTDLARSIKQSLQLIDTSDRRYLNYDKTKLRAFIESSKVELEKPGVVLSVSELDKLRQKVRPIQKAAVSAQFPDLAAFKLEEGEKRIGVLLLRSVVSKSIERLQNDSELNEWVHEGLVVHKSHESKNCEFCGRELPKERISQLEAHFNEEYTDLTSKLERVQPWLTEIKVKGLLPDAVELYDEFQVIYKSALLELENKEDDLAKELDVLKKQIAEKQRNPFSIQFEIRNVMGQITAEIEAARNAVLQIVKDHNQKTANFQTELVGHKAKLELHFVAEGLIQKKYDALAARIDKEQKDMEKKSKKYEDLNKEMKDLEGILANAKKGAEDFNKGLHSFLGRADISLEYDTAQKGYKILRTGTTKVAENLSEGEKTAIAFVYFMIKLKENGNKIEESIVIVDDPISSFDANHLFHSLAYLKATCEKSKQLFILTHNFQYFKLVRDWILNKNNKTTTKSCVYTIEVEKEMPRKSGIQNAHATLISFGSEYQYLFKKLMGYKADATLDLDNCYQVANFSRKLLEGFFSFKHPSGRANFYQLMEVGCRIGNVETVIMQKVYKFINQYSHNELIEFLDSPIDNLLSEGENITSLVLEIINKCDHAHFVEMEQLCQN